VCEHPTVGIGCLLSPEEFWALLEQALRKALICGLDKDKTEAALVAARSEHDKWVGSKDWNEPIAHVVLAALQAATPETGTQN